MLHIYWETRCKCRTFNDLMKNGALALLSRLQSHCELCTCNVKPHEMCVIPGGCANLLLDRWEMILALQLPHEVFALFRIPCQYAVQTAHKAELWDVRRMFGVGVRAWECAGLRTGWARFLPRPVFRCPLIIHRARHHTHGHAL